MSNEVFWSTPTGDIDKIPNNRFSNTDLWSPLSGLEGHEKGKHQGCGKFVRHHAIIYYNKLGKDGLVWVLFKEGDYLYGEKEWKRGTLSAINVVDNLREEISFKSKMLNEERKTDDTFRSNI